MSVSALTDYSTSTVQQRAAASQESSRDSIDFLTLLIAQLTNQDPLNPMEDMDFTSQLAQLQTLQEQIALNETMATMLQDTQMQSATSMIGKDIVGIDNYGNAVSGTVVGVAQSGDDIYVQLNNGSKVTTGNVISVTGGDGNSNLASEMAAAANVIGMFVDAGFDSAMQPVQGIVKEVSVVDGKIMLNLYGGESISWNQVTSMRAPTDDESWYVLPDSVREKVEQAQTLFGFAVSGEDESGNAVTGIVGGAQLDGHDVYLVLFDGTRVNIDSLTSEPRLPEAEDALRDLVGLYATGLDEEGKSVSGKIVDAEDRDDGLALILEDGSCVYYDTISEISAGEDS